MKVNKLKYTNNVIKDMHVLIESDFLISNYPNLSTFPKQFNDVFLSELEEVCKDLDSNNEMIEKLNQSKSKRLGKYCEDLLAAYFDHHPALEVLEKNWQINRNGITFGEVDFILKHGDFVFGMETAFKCYAQFSQGIEGWQGPKRKDSFIQKIEKVQSHQLPIFQSEEVISRYGKISAYFYVKGHLFSSGDIEVAPVFKEVEFSMVNWAEIKGIDFKNRKAYLFPKQAWISGIYFSDSNYQVNPQDLDQKLKNSRIEGKSLILGVRSKNVFENYLIVDD